MREVGLLASKGGDAEVASLASEGRLRAVSLFLENPWERMQNK